MREISHMSTQYVSCHTHTRTHTLLPGPHTPDHFWQLNRLAECSLPLVQKMSSTDNYLPLKPDRFNIRNDKMVETWGCEMKRSSDACIPHAKENFQQKEKKKATPFLLFLFWKSCWALASVFFFFFCPQLFQPAQVNLFFFVVIFLGMVLCILPRAP